MFDIKLELVICKLGVQCSRVFYTHFELSFGIRMGLLLFVSLPKRSQSLNAPPYFDGSNYAFWKVRMRVFLCSINESILDAVDIGWTRLEAAKSTWDKAALAASNANSKTLNAIFCGVSR